MLFQLHIENVAIIEKLDVSLFKGLNVLTGETGAGKSILIDSINALLGSRVSRELIRSGADKAAVQGMFSVSRDIDPVLEGYGIEPQEDNTVIISRIFTESGKNICRVNGTMVTVSALKEIGQKLVDVHGQHDNQSLLRAETHIGLLDLFSGDKLAKEKTEYQEELLKLQSLRTRLRSLSGEGKERERTIDMLRFQVEEIEKAGLYLGEDADLEHQSRILSHAEEIIYAFSHAYESIRGEDTENQSALDLLGSSLEAIQKIEELDPHYASICATLDEVQDKLAEISREVRVARDGIEYDPKLHKSIEERISLIQSLKKKYGETIPDILSFLQQAKARLDEIIRSEELIIGIRNDIEVTEKSLNKRCQSMNGLRDHAAKLLQNEILKELAELEMPKTQFVVLITSCPEAGYTENGTDVVEFLFSPNAGEPPKPLSKIASGGEMSRVMLAVKSILAHIDAIPTLIFDEIDSGVSGKAASKVGEKLKVLGKKHQVLCITHHAGIASLADAHYLIHKSERQGRTLTSVRLLESVEKENEITRLLSGEYVTDAARRLAQELIRRGNTENTNDS